MSPLRLPIPPPGQVINHNVTRSGTVRQPVVLYRLAERASAGRARRQSRRLADGISCPLQKSHECGVTASNTVLIPVAVGPLSRTPCVRLKQRPMYGPVRMSLATRPDRRSAICAARTPVWCSSRRDSRLQRPAMQERRVEHHSERRDPGQGHDRALCTWRRLSRCAGAAAARCAALSVDGTWCAGSSEGVHRYQTDSRARTGA